MSDFICSLCPRRCRALRTDNSGNGICKIPNTLHIARAALHHGEEPCISGTRGSGSVFFAGCPLQCAFCQNHTISRGVAGKAITPLRLANIFCELVEQGAHNINLVSPTPYVPLIKKALKQYKPPVPIVYNSSGYERVETLRSLEGLVDIYLPDFKYISSDLSAALSNAKNYSSIAEQAIQEMIRQTGPMVLDDNGIAQRGTMVRHLVLPGHTKDSLSVIDRLREILPNGVWISLLFQYTPLLTVSGFPELSRRLTTRECDKVWQYLIDSGFTDGYVQGRESATTTMIPVFDGTGV